jgi:hypothetical protein
MCIAIKVVHWPTFIAGTVEQGLQTLATRRTRQLAYCLCQLTGNSPSKPSIGNPSESLSAMVACHNAQGTGEKARQTVWVWGGAVWGRAAASGGSGGTGDLTHSELAVRTGSKGLTMVVHRGPEGDQEECEQDGGDACGDELICHVVLNLLL